MRVFGREPERYVGDSFSSCPVQGIVRGAIGSLGVLACLTLSSAATSSAARADTHAAAPSVSSPSPGSPSPVSSGPVSPSAASSGDTLPDGKGGQPAAAGEVEKLQGFRSAHFGASESEVRTAIVKDFGSDPGAIKASENPYERTRLLKVRVPDVLPGGGTADVVYVFGYKSKRLIEISLVWSKDTDPAMNAERIVGNGDVLRNQFLEAGYRKASIVTNSAVKNGILLFRGEDADDQSSVVILQGTISAAEKGKETLTPLGLALFYLADAKHPDVFKLPRGLF